MGFSMIYDLDYDYHDRIGDDTDYEEYTTIAFNIFDVEHGNFEELTAKLREFFETPVYEARCIIDQNGISYAMLIALSRNIDPDYWTIHTVRNIKTKHAKLLAELDTNGEIKPENRIQNKHEFKLILKRYFDLFPEEENHDEELGKLVVKTLRNDNTILEIMQFTDINIATLLSISHDLSPNFWITNSGKTMRQKLLKFNH